MGLLERWSANKLARAQERDRSDAKDAADRLQRDERKALAVWDQKDQDLHEMLDRVQNDHGIREGGLLMMNKGEGPFQVIQGSALIEPRLLPGPGHRDGRFQGFSLKVANDVPYRVGALKASFVQGDEVQMPIDTGTITITNQRVVFEGTKATHEWSFAKVLGVQHVDLQNAPWTAIRVFDRQETSGFLYAPGRRLREFDSGSTSRLHTSTVRLSKWCATWKSRSRVTMRCVRERPHRTSPACQRSLYNRPQQEQQTDSPLTAPTRVPLDIWLPDRSTTTSASPEPRH